MTTITPKNQIHKNIHHPQKKINTQHKIKQKHTKNPKTLNTKNKNLYKKIITPKQQYKKNKKN